MPIPATTITATAFAFYGDPGYGYHDLGSYLSQDTAVYPGIGVGGSNALRISADSTRFPAQLPPDRTYEGFGFAIVEDAGLPALTSPILSDYTLTLSARAEGQNVGGNQTAQMDVTIFAPDGTIGERDSNPDPLITLRFANGLALNSFFQDSTMNFGDASSIENGSIANFATFYSVANEIQFSTAPNDPVNAFGYDADNAMVLDNIDLSVAAAVPEPSTFACVAAGVLALLTFRRRRPSGLRP